MDVAVGTPLVVEHACTLKAGPHVVARCVNGIDSVDETYVAGGHSSLFVLFLDPRVAVLLPLSLPLGPYHKNLSYRPFVLSGCDFDCKLDGEDITVVTDVLTLRHVELGGGSCLEHDHVAAHQAVCVWSQFAAHFDPVWLVIFEGRDGQPQLRGGVVWVELKDELASCQLKGRRECGSWQVLVFCELPSKSEPVVCHNKDE